MTKREFHTEDGETFEIIDDPDKPKGKPKPKPIYRRRQYLISLAVAILLTVIGLFGYLLIPVRVEERVVPVTVTDHPPAITEVIVVVTATPPRPVSPIPTRALATPTVRPDPCETILNSATGRIAMTARLGDSTEAGLFLMDSEGRNLCLLDARAGGLVRWSRNGERLLFTPPDWEIAVLDVQSGGIAYVTSKDQGLSYSPSWSPDDSQIVYQQQDGNLSVINTASSNQHPLTTDNARNEDPVWSPDGQWIAFASTRAFPDAAGKRDNFEIFLIAPDGSVVRRLTENALYDHMPAWSPDSSQIAYVANVDPESDARTDLFIMDADCDQLPGSCEANRRNLTHSGVGVSYPRWLPDGQHIAYLANVAGGDEAIYVLNIATGQSERITPAILRVFAFDWWES